MCYNGMFSSSRNLQMMPEAFRAAGACTSCCWVSHSLIDDIQNKTCLKGTRPLSPLIVPGYLPSVVIGSTSTSFPWTWGMGQQFNISGHFTGEQQSRTSKTFHGVKIRGKQQRGSCRRSGGATQRVAQHISASQLPPLLRTLQFFNVAPTKTMGKERGVQGE